MRDNHPNLFEKQCDESAEVQAGKDAIRAIREVREHYDGPLPVHQNQDEKLAEAQRLVQEVVSSERGRIGIRLASKYTRNPDYRHHDPDDPGVIEVFEEWKPERDCSFDSDP